jgi:hypothetical protein
MSTGLVKQREHVCQLAGGLLRYSRGSENNNNEISFVLDPLVMKFCRYMCKYMRDFIVKGFIIKFNRSIGNAVVVDNSFS